MTMNSGMKWSLALLGIALGTVAVTGLPRTAQEQSAEKLLEEGRRALLARRYAQAEEIATRAIELRPKSPAAFILRARARQLLGKVEDAVVDLTEAIKLEPSAEARVIRGECYSALDRHAAAIADFSAALQLDSKLPPALHHRGREYFKHGEIKKSIADFDRLIELMPQHENECWERGLSRYYAGEFAKAQKSFEDYHKVGAEDIENGLWRMLSQAEVNGLPAAQQALFKYEPKRRPPFPLLHELYSGKSTPEAVLEHACDGAKDDKERETRTFYAQLYIGLWHMVKGDRAKAVEHLEEAVARRSTDYMWYVARHQLAVLKPGAPVQ